MGNGKLSDTDRKEIANDGADARRLKGKHSYQAFISLTKETIDRSWEVTKIPLHLFGAPTSKLNEFDAASDAVHASNGGKIANVVIDVDDFVKVSELDAVVSERENGEDDDFDESESDSDETNEDKRKEDEPISDDARDIIDVDSDDRDKKKVKVERTASEDRVCQPTSDKRAAIESGPRKQALTPAERQQKRRGQLRVRVLALEASYALGHGKCENAEEKAFREIQIRFAAEHESVKEQCERLAKVLAAMQEKRTMEQKSFNSLFDFSQKKK